MLTLCCYYFQVKILNKLASAKASGQGTGSKVLTDMIEGLEDPEFAVELRLKIDQNHTDIKGGYVNTILKFWLNVPSLFFLFLSCQNLIMDYCIRSFRDYGEAVIKHLENTLDLNPKLKKAPVNYEGVSSRTKL